MAPRFLLPKSEPLAINILISGIDPRLGRPRRGEGGRRLFEMQVHNPVREFETDAVFLI
jgi:hypothetical protein